MRILIGTDIHVYKEESKLYVTHQVFNIVKRYYESFGAITLYSRQILKKPKEELFDISYMIERSIIFNNLLETLVPNLCLEEEVKKSDLIIGRFHSFSGCLVGQMAHKYNKPFLAEVMGDAFEAYWNHGFKGKLIAHFIEQKIKKTVRNADYALYVTRNFLQEKYPCGGLTNYASNINLNHVSSKVLQLRLDKLNTFNKNKISLMTTANVDVEAKGHRYVIEAIPKLNKLGIKAMYYIIGGGDNKKLKSLAKLKGVDSQIVFLGRMKNEDVLSELENVDLYVQPSLQEGLPRALIEAMSRACPCLGARTAGIPELLDDECIFERKSSDAIVAAITKMLNSDMSQYARNNFEKSKDYYSDVLDQRRNVFFDTIRQDIEKRST